MGVGLTGTILSCLTMNTVIATGAVVVLVLSLALEIIGLVIVTINEKRDALSRPRKVYRDTHYLPDMSNKDRVWREWKRHCNLTAKAEYGWTIKWD